MKTETDHPTLTVMEELRDIEETIRIQKVMRTVHLERGTKKYRDTRVDEQWQIIATAYDEIEKLNRDFKAAKARAADCVAYTKRLEARKKVLTQKPAVDQLLRLMKKLAAAGLDPRQMAEEILHDSQS